MKLTRHNRREFAKGMLASIALIVCCGLIGPYKMPQVKQKQITDIVQVRIEADPWARRYVNGPYYEALMSCQGCHA